MFCAITITINITTSRLHRGGSCWLPSPESRRRRRGRQAGKHYRPSIKTLHLRVLHFTISLPARSETPAMSHEHHQHHQTAATTTSTSTSISQYHQQRQLSPENSNSNNTTYRPRSPDLSAFLLPAQQLQQQQPIFHPSYQESSSANVSGDSWQQQQRQGSSGTALTGLPSGASFPPATHRGSYDASPYFSPQGIFSLGTAQSQGQGSYFGAGAVGQQQHQGPRKETLGYGSAGASTGVTAGEYSRLTHSPTAVSGAERFLPQQQPQTQPEQGFWQAPASGFTATAQELPTQAFSASLSQQRQQHQPQYNMPPSRRKRSQIDEHDDSGDVEYTPESSNAGKTSRKRKSDIDQAWTLGRAPGEVGPSLGIDIKTKFPVARIKRIMQADEDVGKVAQATPTAVCEFTTFSPLICRACCAYS